MNSQLSINPELRHFIDTEALPGTGLDEAAFWAGFEQIVSDFAPRNAALLARRAELQAQIDAWHRENRGKPIDAATYRSFLTYIGYLLPHPAPFGVETTKVDPEIATMAGPQLVVPVSNARYALNAGNARWGSLYDALYGTDAIDETGELARGRGFNKARGAAVVARAKAFLDEAVPLAAGSHADCAGYSIAAGALVPALATPSQLAGYTGDAASRALFLKVCAAAFAAASAA